MGDDGDNKWEQVEVMWDVGWEVKCCMTLGFVEMSEGLPSERWGNPWTPKDFPLLWWN